MSPIPAFVFLLFLFLIALPVSSDLTDPVSAYQNNTTAVAGLIPPNTASNFQYNPDHLFVKYKTGQATSSGMAAVQKDLNALAGATVAMDYTPLGMNGLQLVKVGSGYRHRCCQDLFTKPVRGVRRA